MKFFHNSTNNKRNINKISKTKDTNGNLIDDLKLISEQFVNCYRSLLNNYDYVDRRVQNEMLSSIPRLISEADNKWINSKLSIEEVKDALFQVYPEKALGLDGFQEGFFQKYWHFPREDIWKAVEATRNLGSILSEINNTFFTLIPKNNDSLEPGYFLPISLCNTIYKIISKCLANRLKTFLPLIISEEQIGFVPNRSILDRIVITQEIVHIAQYNKEACVIPTPMVILGLSHLDILL